MTTAESLEVEKEKMRGTYDRLIQERPLSGNLLSKDEHDEIFSDLRRLDVAKSQSDRLCEGAPAHDPLLVSRCRRKVHSA